MDFDLDEDQQLFRQSAREFLAAECGSAVRRRLEASETGHAPELWARIAALGWTGLAIPETYGGAGWDLVGLAVLCEEIGRAAFDSPLFATAVGALAVLEAGSDEQRRALLPEVAQGRRILALALAEREVAYDPRFVATAARREGEGFVLQGTKLFVPYATVADDLLVVARTEGRAGDERGLGLFRVARTSPGLRAAPLATMAPGKQFEVELGGVRVARESLLGGSSDAVAALRRVLEAATALRCAEMVGGAEAELETTAAYTRERVQFGRPIGTFQAVQHRLADMFTDVQGARWTSYQAAWRIARGLPAARELAIAKSFTSDAAQRVAFGAQQLHGGYGVDMAHDLQFFFRRAKALELELGPAPLHLEALERELGLVPSSAALAAG